MTRYWLVGLYLGAIVVANVTVAEFGAKAAIYNAFALIGLDLVSRDRLHDYWRGHLLRKQFVVVDGHTRLQAAKRARVKEIPVVVRRFASEEQAFAFAVAAQRDRRNLTKEEIATAIARAELAGREKSTGQVLPNAPRHQKGRQGSVKDPIRQAVVKKAAAADNDAYSNWSEDRYLIMLQSIWGLKGCLFVTAPDVVGDADRTLELFHEWRDELSSVLQPVAYVAQDGCTHDLTPWDSIDALFIGGTSEFKLGDQARELVRSARARDKHVHMGRVNSLQRLRYAKAIGCDSVDGSKFNQYRDTYLRQGLADVREPAQGMLA